MTWRATSLADIAHHVIGCILSQETRNQSAFDNVTGNMLAGPRMRRTGPDPELPFGDPGTLARSGLVDLASCNAI
jgi:hypothetical protein